MEDIFVTKLYSSGVLRYAETNSDIDMGNFWKFTAKGPNSLGNNDSRRIPVRQRTLHPSMAGLINIADTSSSDPGRSGSLSPYCDMKSMYFDDSLYENEMHFKIAQYLDEDIQDEDTEVLRINVDNAEDYNKVLDKMCHTKNDSLRMSGIMNTTMEIVVEDDPRLHYRKFNEATFLMNEKSQ